MSPGHEHSYCGIIYQVLSRMQHDMTAQPTSPITTLDFPAVDRKVHFKEGKLSILFELAVFCPGQ